MSLSPNTAQTREMTELRNHLKWLDEERRKSSRKMTELEQRLAQQGRELAERDQKITELERYIANFSQRLDSLPDALTEASNVDQRLQDLEWHVANMNTTLSRVPSPDDAQKQRQEDRAYLDEEIARAINATHERAEASQSLLETQLRSEIEAVRSSDSWQPLASQLERQAEEINLLKAALPELSDRLRETTGNLVIDFQTLRDAFSEHSERLQETSDNLAADFQSNMNTLAQNVQNHVDERIGEITRQQHTWDSRLLQLEQGTDAPGERWAELDKLDQELQAQIRDVMSAVNRFEQELELRQAEELRVSNLLTVQEERFAPLSSTIEDLSVTNMALNNRLIDAERTIQELAAQAREVNDSLKPSLSDVNHRLALFSEKLTNLTNSATKTEVGLQAISGDHMEFREMSVSATDELQQRQNEIVRQMESWRLTMDENKDTVERFTQQWSTLSNQYKEARMAVQNFAHWQKQLEQQKREASELLRLESNRMQAKWDGYLLEVQEKLKSFELEFGQKWQAFEMENEQKWSAARRSEKLWREEISAVDDLIQKLQQDNRNLIWRVQNAQADAIKKWPRLLMEEVEKAVEINPSRRLTSVTAPPSGEMSVVDAIEQGLITIDYNDDVDIDEL